MYLLAHETMEEAQAAADVLKALGPAARRLLAECVEKSGVTRQSMSASAKALETAGFLFVRETGTIWLDSFDLSPTLAGEEALECLDETHAAPTRVAKQGVAVNPIP